MNRYPSIPSKRETIGYLLMAASLGAFAVIALFHFAGQH
jgi:hypothetical protein